MNWSALDWRHPRPGLRRRPAGAGDARAARHAGAGARHRLHRPGDRADRRARRDRRRCAGPARTAASRCRPPRSCAALLGARAADLDRARARREQQEALIGVLFVLAACGGILLLAGNPHGGEHLKDLLVGQILWVEHARSCPGWRRCPRCCSLALCAGLGRAAGPLRLLRRVRAGGHRLGATGGRLPGVLQPDHAGARDARAPRAAPHCGGLRRSAPPATRSGWRCRRCSTCPRAR